MIAFAQPIDVEVRWRPLSTAENELVFTLLEDASRRVRRRWQTVDARVAAGSLDEGDVRMVVAGMVKRALISMSMDGVSQATDTAGPFSHSRTFANPIGNLYFTVDDIAILSGTTGNRALSVRLTIAGDP